MIVIGGGLFRFRRQSGPKTDIRSLYKLKILCGHCGCGVKRHDFVYAGHRQGFFQVRRCNRPAVGVGVGLTNLVEDARLRRAVLDALTRGREPAVGVNVRQQVLDQVR